MDRSVPCFMAERTVCGCVGLNGQWGKRVSQRNSGLRAEDHEENDWLDLGKGGSSPSVSVEGQGEDRARHLSFPTLSSKALGRGAYQRGQEFSE